MSLSQLGNKLESLSSQGTKIFLKIADLKYKSNKTLAEKKRLANLQKRKKVLDSDRVKTRKLIKEKLSKK